MRSVPPGDPTTRPNPDPRQAARPALRHDDRGTATAEFAIVLPAVLVVLGLVIGGVALAAHRIVLVSAAADAARLEARGESAAPALERLGTGVTIERTTEQGLHCVALAAAPIGGPLSSITVRGASCAAVSDVAAIDD